MHDGTMLAKKEPEPPRRRWFCHPVATKILLQVSHALAW
jgi:hypothetical protein